ncbi:ribbon-helix-helix domain-containing protein [Burkholderia sp. YIM B11467]
MSISLPSEMADGVRQQVASGTNATSEVTNPQRAALRGLAGHKPK